jgi:hypothetical protein
MMQQPSFNEKALDTKAYAGNIAQSLLEKDFAATVLY